MQINCELLNKITVFSSQFSVNSIVNYFCDLFYNFVNSMFDYSTPFNTERSSHNKIKARRMSECAAMIFAQSTKEPHEPQLRPLTA